MSKPVFLIGYMASGKTTLGRAFARAKGLQFIDLDFYIEQRYRRKVSEIFAERGEEEFRRLESMMLREIGEFEDVVVSCGGGTPCHGDNMSYMNTRGLTVFLDASVEVIVRRLQAAKNVRPIVAQYGSEELPGFVEGHLASRLPWYRQAMERIDASDLESRSSIAVAVEKLGELVNKNT